MILFYFFIHALRATIKMERDEIVKTGKVNFNATIGGKDPMIEILKLVRV